MRSMAVFSVSMFAALLVLGLERLAGIGWDFHPDAVTYATNAHDTVSLIVSSNILQLFNNLYYFWASLLGQSVVAMTISNMVLFSATNVLLFSSHDRWCNYNGQEIKWLFALSLILLNPYRLHLATTALKDTMILFFAVVVIVRAQQAWFVIPVLFALRVASIFYLIMLVSRRHLVALLMVAVLAAAAFGNSVTDRLLEFNAADMRLRDFDQIPNFRELELFGVLARAVIWPLLAVTGLFAVLSPALAYIPVAVGCLMNQLYCRLVLGRFAFPLAVIVPMAIFAAVVTGFTAYIRYVYPILILLPILAIRQAVEDSGHERPGDLSNPALAR